MNDVLQWLAMQAYFGERALFDQASAILDGLGRDKSPTLGVCFGGESSGSRANTADTTLIRNANRCYLLRTIYHFFEAFPIPFPTAN